MADNTVYLLVNIWDNGQDIYGVFSSPGKAIEFLGKLLPNYDDLKHISLNGRYDTYNGNERLEGWLILVEDVDREFK